MKKLQLLFAMMVIGMASATASEIVSEKKGEDLTITKRYRYTQPILFVERGVEFLIFPDGSLDFNTEFGNWYNDDYYYRGTKSRRGSINASYNAPGERVNYSTSRYRPRVMRVIRDRWGNVRRIGNVSINYDFYGRVKRVGSVYLRYNRGKLVQVGGLDLIYGRKGRLINMRGHVSHGNQGCGFCGTTSCSIDHFNNGHGMDWFNNSHNDHYDNDDYYYYHKDGKQKKYKKIKKVKRRKYDD